MIKYILLLIIASLVLVKSEQYDTGFQNRDYKIQEAPSMFEILQSVLRDPEYLSLNAQQKLVVLDMAYDIVYDYYQNHYNTKETNDFK